MPRAQYVVMTVEAQPDGPGATVYRVLLRGAVQLGERDQHYVLYVRQPEGHPAPYEHGVQVELDERLVAEEPAA